MLIRSFWSRLHFKPRHRARFGVLGLLLLWPAVAGADNAEVPQTPNASLLFYHSELCEYCDKWKEDVGAYYGKTAESKILPLRAVDTDEKLPEDIAHIGRIYFTPTFIVFREGREVGRIVGYIDEDFFWGYLKPLVEKVRLANSQDQQATAPQVSHSDISQQGKTCGTC